MQGAPGDSIPRQGLGQSPNINPSETPINSRLSRVRILDRDTEKAADCGGRSAAYRIQIVDSLSAGWIQRLMTSSVVPFFSSHSRLISCWISELIPVRIHSVAMPKHAHL